MQTNFNTGVYSASSHSSTKTSQEENSADIAKTNFLEFMNMSKAEQYFEMFLRQEGLTKEELEALPPKDREKILDRIHEKIKRAVEEQAT